MQTAAIYIRVSTTEQTELSPNAQLRLIMDYAQKNNLYVSSQYIYKDEGISGRKAEKRPAFMKMIATAKKKPKPFDTILVHKFDRFSRSREDSIVYKSLLRKECGIQVISITEQLENDKFSIILEAMLEAMAEYYSLNLADEVTKGMTEKALRGGYQASPPLGYKIEHKGEIPIIIPEQAELIQKIFQMYVYGKKSVFSICKELNALGYRTKYNKLFEKRSIEYILQNPTYTGYTRWNRTEHSTNRVKDPSQWIMKPGLHPAIITNELFQAAQERYRTEYHPRNSKPAEVQKHWLSGLLKCSSCGCSLSVTHRMNKKSKSHPIYWYFQCYGYSKGKCPVSHQISEKKIVKTTIGSLDSVIKTAPISFHKSTASQYHSPNNDSLFQNQLEKLKEKEQRIKDAYINGIDSLSEYKQNKLLLSKEKETIIEMMKKQKETLRTNLIENIPNQTLQKITSVLNDNNTDFLTKNKAVHSIIKKIIFNRTTETIDIYYCQLP